ncbi:hypothetical protein L484_013938 [Morus notabilis]|uniref:Uncharacterized protein n=1 Tax=Morus notabilis TaxID=981085 RepID=W9QRF0_9ROSA|nr:hypothetical protein L484_013938 [Morus notabilis]
MHDEVSSRVFTVSNQLNDSLVAIALSAPLFCRRAAGCSTTALFSSRESSSRLATGTFLSHELYYWQRFWSLVVMSASRKHMN